MEDTIDQVAQVHPVKRQRRGVRGESAPPPARPVRDTTNRNGATLTFGSEAWQEFIAGLRRPSQINYRMLSVSYRLAGCGAAGDPRP